MSKMNPKVDRYFMEGCGRCHLVGTPECKVHSWHEPMEHVRMILLDIGLKEDYKWSQPCYTFENKNLVILSAFKNYGVLSFFKGALLKDPHKILKKPGENSQAGRMIQFTSVQEVLDMEPIIRAYIKEAIEVEKAGLKVAFKKDPEPVPEELQNKFDADPAFKAAFESLTPGRQRGYILYFAAAKQPKTREARIEKYVEKILSGKGFHDR